MPNEKAGYLRQDILGFINGTIEEIGRAPSRREIQAKFNLASPSHVDHHLRMLEKAGLITLIPNEAYGIRPTKTIPGVPVAGHIAAGEPLEISDKPNEWIDLGLETSGKSIYALKVKGKSMIEDGIYDGDYVLIRKQNNCEHGEIIVAVRKSAPPSATLKRFKLVKGGVLLEASNSLDININSRFVPKEEWDEEWEIQGIVVAIFRRFRKPKSRFR